MILKMLDWEGERALKINEIWMLERNKKSLNIWWFSKPKSRKIVEKQLKTLFFSLALFNSFWEGLGRVLGGFWEGFGAYLASLGALLAPFLGGCIFNALQKGF